MARGIAARTKGDIFYRNNEKFCVEQVMVSSYDEFCLKSSSFSDYKITEFSKRKERPKFSIAIFLDSEEEKLCFVKHLPSIGDGTGFGKWQNKDFYKQTGFVYDSIAAKKELLPFKPSKLVGDITVSLYDVKDVVVSNVKSLEIKGEIPNGFSDKIKIAFEQLDNNQMPVFKDCLHEHTALRDYFGEVIAPIMFVKNIGIEGVTIEQILCNKTSNIPLIRYQTFTNANLIDSYLIWPDKEIGLSSKGNGGASASIFSIFSEYENLEKTAPEVFKTLTTEYKQEIKFINFIVSCGIKAGPVVAAYLIGLITYDDMVAMLELLGQKQMLEDTKFIVKVPETENLAHTEYDFTRFGNTKLKDDCVRYKNSFSPKFYDIISERKVRDPDKALFQYFTLSSIAKAVAHHLNYRSVLRINEFFYDVLKATDFIQINAKTKVVGNDIHFVSFKTIYPPVINGRVIIEADKSFYSTKQPQGGFGFKLLA